MSFRAKATATLGPASLTSRTTKATNTLGPDTAYKAPASPAGYSDEVMADGPIMYSRMAGADLAATGADISGNNNNVVTATGTPTYNQAGLLTGDSNTSCGFTGGQGLNYASTWPNQTSYTIECWAKWPSGTGFPLIDRDQSGARHWQFRINGSKLEFLWWNALNGPWTVTGATALSANTTYHLVATYDATNGKGTIYINGVQDQQLTGSVASGGTTGCPFRVGIGYAGTGSPFNYFTGSIDEVAFYNKVLAPARILAHYSAGNPPNVNAVQQIVLYEVPVVSTQESSLTYSRVPSLETAAVSTQESSLTYSRVPLFEVAVVSTLEV